MKWRFVLVIIPLLLNYTNAQNLISGVVKNSDDSSSIGGTEIFIAEVQKGTVSDSGGYYKFTNIPNGILHIQFNHLGFKAAIKEIVIDKHDNYLNVDLRPTSIELSEIVVTGNSLNEQDNFPYRVEAITSRELKNNAFVNITNSLALLPGVSILSSGAGISKPVVRGLFGYRIAEIVDGVKFDNQEWQNEHGFGMDNIGIGNIEIIQGPAALLYGSDAVGGVINFVDPKNAPVGRTIGEYNLSIFSNTLGAITSFSLKRSETNWSWQLYTGGESNADYSAGGNVRVANSRFAGLSAKGILTYSADWGFSNLVYSYSHHLYGVIEPDNLNKPENEERFERGFDGPHHVVDFHIASLKNLFFTGHSKFKFNLGFQNNHRVEDEGNENNFNSKDLGELDIILNTFSFDGAWIYPINNTELTIGVQGNIKSNENEGGRILVPDADMNELSGYLYLKKNLDKFHIEGGLRFDRNRIKTKETGNKDSAGYMRPLNLTYNSFNWALGGVYDITGNWNIKLNFATGFRAPNLAELSSNGVHEGTVRYEIGDPYSKVEKNIQIDASLIFQNSRMRFSFSVFDNLMTDFIYLNPTMNFLDKYQVFQFVQNNASITGGEIYGDIKLTKVLDFSVSYSKVTGKKSGGGYLPFMPADKIVTTLSFDLNNWGRLENVTFSLRGRSYLNQYKISAGEEKTPGYFLVDAGFGAGIHLGNQPVNFNFSAVNLLDKSYMDHLSLLRPLSIGDMGINISLGINVPLSF